MSAKKMVAKATAKATAKAAAKAASNKKTTPKAKSKTAPAVGTAGIKMLRGTASTASSNETRRPANNPDMPTQLINFLNTDLNSVKSALEDYAAHLRSLDRKRLNGVGMKKQGFIDRALALAEENAEFLPHWLTLDKFEQDDQYFMNFKTIHDLSKQVTELIWNITSQSADITYTDALEFYSSVKDAAKRRIDAAETPYRELEPFFKAKGNRKGAGEKKPTVKQQLRDSKGIIKGTKEGRIEVENFKPKLTGGVHKVIDEEFKDTAQFKETEEGEV